MTDRKVTLTAEVGQYIQAMNDAADATRQLLDLGIEQKDLAGAVTAALTLAKSGSSISQRIDITTSPGDGKTSIVVDGIDITYWIAREAIIVESNADGQTTVTVKLTAPTVTHTIVP